MSFGIGNLSIDLGLNSTSFKTGLNQAQGQINSFSSSVTKAMAGVAAAFAAAFSVNAMGQMADQWSDLNSQLANATGGAENGMAAMSRLQEVSRNSYSSLKQTTEAFLGQTRTLTNLGVAMGDQLDITEAVNNALVISATRGDKARSVWENWTKALRQGSLRGNELTAVINNSDRLAQALADTMGINVNELAAYGAQGKITREVMLGITDQLEALREEAERMPPTLQDGFGIIGDAVFQFVGRMDQATGSSGNFATMLVAVGDAITAATAPAIQLVNVISASMAPAMASIETSIGLVATALAGLFSSNVQSGLLDVAAIAGRVMVGAMNALARVIDFAAQNMDALINIGKIWVGLQLAAITVNISRAFFAYARTIQVAAMAKAALAAISKVNITTLGILAAIILQATGQLEGFISKVEEAGRALLSLLPEGLEQGIQSATNDLNNLWNSFDGIDAALSDVNTEIPTFTEGLNGVTGAAKGVGSGIEEAAASYSKFGDIAQQVNDRIIGGLVDLFESAISGAQDMWSIVGNVLKDIGRMFLQSGLTAPVGRPYAWVIT